MFSLDDNNHKPKATLGFDPSAEPLTKHQIKQNDDAINDAEKLFESWSNELKSVKSIWLDFGWDPCRVETDAELRGRIARCAPSSVGIVTLRRIATATGDDLDIWASRFDMRRIGL
jgi:hypothetical protein